jgi:hypothetical protein
LRNSLDQRRRGAGLAGVQFEITDRHVKGFEVRGAVQDFEDATYVGMG